VLDRLDGAGVLAAGVSVHTPDLDDVFLALTGHAKARTDAGDAGVASNTGDTGDGGARPAAGRPHAPSTTRKGEPR
jgi:ABC-2 type transport system ATP-binding protein